MKARSLTNHEIGKNNFRISIKSLLHNNYRRTMSFADFLIININFLCATCFLAICGKNANSHGDRIIHHNQVS